MPTSVLFSLPDGLARCQADNQGANNVLDALKQAVLIHDKIHIENGELKVSCYEKMAFSNTKKSSTMSYLERVERQDYIGLIDLRGAEIVNNQLVQTLQFSFEPLIEGIKSLAPFISVVDSASYSNSCGELDNAVEQTIGKSSLYDNKSYPDNALSRAHRVRLSQMLYELMLRSGRKAASLGDCLRLDARLNEKCKIVGSSLPTTVSIEEKVFSEIISVAVPEFRTLSFEDAVELRNDPLWIDFRGLIDRVTERLLHTTPSDQVKQSDVLPAYCKELLADLSAKQPSGRQLALDLTLNGASVVPGLGIFATAMSTAKTILEHSTERTRWLTFVDRISKRASGF